jgi:hypothetical protein
MIENETIDAQAVRLEVGCKMICVVLKVNSLKEGSEN